MVQHPAQRRPGKQVAAWSSLVGAKCPTPSSRLHLQQPAGARPPVPWLPEAAVRAPPGRHRQWQGCSAPRCRGRSEHGDSGFPQEPKHGIGGCRASAARGQLALMKSVATHAHTSAHTRTTARLAPSLHPVHSFGKHGSCRKGTSEARGGSEGNKGNGRAPTLQEAPPTHTSARLQRASQHMGAPR